MKLLILTIASLLPQPDAPRSEDRGGQRVLWRMDRVEQQPGRVVMVPANECAYLMDVM